MTKVQNCPLCGWKFQELYGKKYRCFAPSCALGGAGMTLETWNRIRIAPDDKEVETLPFYDGATNGYSGSRSSFITIKDWMNPQYPKEQDEDS